MPSAKKTPNYNLTQYADNGTDKVSFMGDYNGDMVKVDTALHDNATTITTKADKATTYSKTDVDTKLSAKADTATTYSKTDVDSRLTAKADAASTYSKTDVDSRLTAKADAANTYSKTDVDSRLTAKADAATTYSKSDVDSKINPIANNFAKKLWVYPHNIVCIGDSYGEGYGTSNPSTDGMYVVMGNLLGATIHNYAVGGAGFVHGATIGGGHQYGTQVSDAIAQLGAGAQNIDTVIVTGGQNDVGIDPNQIKTSVISTFNAIKNGFPNAKIVFYPMEYGANPIPTPHFQQYTNLIQWGQSLGFVSVVPYGYTVLRGRYDMVFSDFLHPNTEGAKFMGGVLANILTGGSGEVPQLGGFSVGGAATVLDGANYATYQSGKIGLRAAIKPKSGHGVWSAGEKVAFLPPFCKAANPTGFFPCMTTAGNFILMGINNETNDNAPTLMVATTQSGNADEILINCVLPETF